MLDRSPGPVVPFRPARHPARRSARRRVGASALVLALAGATLAAVTTLGDPALASPQTASAAKQTTSTSRAASPAPLRVAPVQLGCECGGAGYLWGYRGAFTSFRGAREGYRYSLVMRRGPGMDGPARAAAQTYGGGGSAFLPFDDLGVQFGETYSFVVQERRKGRLVRTSPARLLTIPVPVAHPTRVGLDSETLPSGEEVLVAGRTYTFTYDGTWEDGARFASGVDRYIGQAPGDDRFGYYEEDGYPLPFTIGTDEPIRDLTVPADLAGVGVNVQVVGYRPSAGGEPVVGSEWGFRFFLRVVSEEEFAAATAG